jgi:hypothetical protein
MVGKLGAENFFITSVKTSNQFSFMFIDFRAHIFREIPCALSIALGIG